MRFVIDKAHSNVGFVVRHAGIGKTRGSFGEYEGAIEFTEVGKWAGASVEVKIDAASVDTANEGRDNHLRSPDFFEVEKFPTWTFKSTDVYGGTDEFNVVGDLTIHGVTESVKLDVTFEGTVVDPAGDERVAFEARTTISRKKFGLAWNTAMEAGGFLVGDRVNIVLEIEAIKEA